VLNALRSLPQLREGLGVLDASQWFRLLVLFFLTASFSRAGLRVSWTLFGLGVGPPIDRLPEGDPAVRRLMEGIARRLARLHQRKDQALPATQMILEEVIEAAERLREAAAKLADKAASMDDPMTNPGVADASTARGRRRAAPAGDCSALDDALCGGGRRPRHSLLLTRMREETAFARRVLPELEAVREA